MGWQVTLCDAVWQVTLRSSEVGSHEELYTYGNPLTSQHAGTVTFYASTCYSITGNVGILHFVGY